MSSPSVINVICQRVCITSSNWLFRRFSVKHTHTHACSVLSFCSTDLLVQNPELLLIGLGPQKSTNAAGLFIRWFHACYSTDIFKAPYTCWEIQNKIYISSRSILTKDRIACHAVTENWMIPFTLQQTPNAFQWAGQLSKIAPSPSRGGSRPPNIVPWAHMSQHSIQTDQTICNICSNIMHLCNACDVA